MALSLGFLPLDVIQHLCFCGARTFLGFVQRQKRDRPTPDTLIVYNGLKLKRSMIKKAYYLGEKGEPERLMCS